jgi:hypothetical protein
MFFFTGEEGGSGMWVVCIQTHTHTHIYIYALGGTGGAEGRYRNSVVQSQDF